MYPTAGVCTTAGTVTGTQHGPVTVFRGIPYAQPPVGRLRFASPQPPTSWQGVRNAAAFGPPAPQAGAPNSDHETEWLTLNIWSPDLGTAGLPVMVWIHGGRYLEGTSANPHQDATALAATGVVVVSVNYRVGMEGFAHIVGAPNNRGLLDQVAALQWVQDNIRAFGGDPANVTVFGQSAGGGSIAALLTMPATAGLLHRAIIQSMPGTYFTERLAASISSEIASELHATPTVDELQQFPPYQLVTASHALLARMPTFTESWGPMALTPTSFSPIIDGTTLPQAPWQGFAQGATRHIDLLLGHTRDEYSLFNERRGQPVTNSLLEDTIRLVAPTQCGPGDYRAAYPAATTSQLYETVNADWLFRMPCLHLADAHRNGGGRTWLYELAWSFNATEAASHSLDMLLIFGTLDRSDMINHPAAHPGAADEYDAVSDAMRTDWSAFASSGRPGWNTYDPHHRNTRVYDATTTDQRYPHDASRQLWADHTFTALDLAPRR